MPAAAAGAIEKHFLATADAVAAQQTLTRTRDGALIDAYTAAIAPESVAPAALLACGPYAAGQTFPYSELDVVLLVEDGQQAERIREVLPEFARLLWNAGLRVNSAVLSVAECLQTIEQAGVPALTLLERRFLAGDEALHQKLEAALPGTLASRGGRLSQRLCELARARHNRYRNTPYHAEPDVKDAPGGFEDVRLVRSLSAIKGEDAPQGGEWSRADALVSYARCFLHFRTARDQNTLDFEAQEALAIQVAPGRPPSDWMRDYFHGARIIFNEAHRAIEIAERSRRSMLQNLTEYRSRLSNQEFTLSHESVLLRNPGQLANDGALVFRLLEFVARHGVAPAAETERRLEAARDAFAEFCSRPQPLWAALRSVLACPHAALALRTMEATGLMRGLFPEWAAIEHRVAAGREHRYTLDEETLLAIGQVLELPSRAEAERRRFAALLAEIDDVALLVLALLFLEIGSEGASDAMARTEMPESAQSTVEFLIRNRSVISEAMTGRDMDDPETAQRLAAQVGTVERLKLLSLITYSGIMTLTDEAKIPWRLDQLWRGYSAAQHQLLRELETDRIQQPPEAIAANADVLKGFPSRYLRARTPAEIQAHLRLYDRSRPTGVAVELAPAEGVYRLTVVARDRPSLFASFAAAISSFGLDIVKAEAFSNARGIILDTFVLADPQRMLQQNPGEADRLTDLMQRIALGKTDAQRLLRGCHLPGPGKRTAAPRVQFDSEASPTATLVEIETEDRQGLLYSLATVFSTNACNIDVVLVDTKGHRAIDVFYVAQDGRKLPPEVQANLKGKLLAAC